MSFKSKSMPFIQDNCNKKVTYMLLLTLAIACGVASIFLPYYKSGDSLFSVDKCLGDQRRLNCDANIALPVLAILFGIVGFFIVVFKDLDPTVCLKTMFGLHVSYLSVFSAACMFSIIAFGMHVGQYDLIMRAQRGEIELKEGFMFAVASMILFVAIVVFAGTHFGTYSPFCKIMPKMGF